jgi:hypothetical protein
MDSFFYDFTVQGLDGSANLLGDLRGNNSAHRSQGLPRRFNRSAPSISA